MGAAKKTIFSSCTVFSFDVVREVETDYITVFFEETTFEEGRNEELFNKSAAWIAKHLVDHAEWNGTKPSMPTGNFVIVVKFSNGDYYAKEVEENVDVDLSKKRLRSCSSRIRRENQLRISKMRSQFSI